MGRDLQSEVWLIKSRLNPYPVRGVMTLVAGKVAVVVNGGADCAAAIRQHLEDQTGIAGLAERLKAGEAVTVLEFVPGDAKVSFPAIAGGYIGDFELGGQTWNIAMAYPGGAAISNVVRMKMGRELAREWKQALG
jgi:hypothetical protein